MRHHFTPKLGKNKNYNSYCKWECRERLLPYVDYRSGHLSFWKVIWKHLLKYKIHTLFTNHSYFENLSLGKNSVVTKDSCIRMVIAELVLLAENRKVNAHQYGNCWINDDWPTPRTLKRPYKRINWSYTITWWDFHEIFLSEKVLN